VPDQATGTTLQTGFDTADLADLAARNPSVAVSMFLPTHTSGRETRQDPIRLNNLIGQAQAAMVASGADPDEADAILRPAGALIDDH
jgi:hypothetical protein